LPRRHTPAPPCIFPFREAPTRDGDEHATITCPGCGTEIALSEALAEQFRQENETRFERLAGQAQARARADFAVEKQLLEGQLAAERQQREAAQRAELELRREKSALDERTRGLDLEVARRVDAERRQLEAAIRNGVAERHDLKLKEKDRLIDELRQALETARRKSEQGSQERQGEVLEIDVQAELERRFPHDRVMPVPKGARGADLVHEVRDAAQRVCGTIVWEAKNTRRWQPAWLDKLKADQRALGAGLAVMVSAALPDGIVEFGRVDGVWIAGLRAWPALALALREQLIAVAFAHAAESGKQEKIEILYRYLSGDAFRSRIEAMVEAFAALQSGLNRERGAMERIWKEREKQIERVLATTAGMYGEVRGILGTSLPPVPALELDPAATMIEDQTAAAAG
jgi:hypothetical protein